jgi:hypothetical protein
MDFMSKCDALTTWLAKQKQTVTLMEQDYIASNPPTREKRARVSSKTDLD